MYVITEEALWKTLRNSQEHKNDLTLAWPELGVTLIAVMFALTLLKCLRCIYSQFK